MRMDGGCGARILRRGLRDAQIPQITPPYSEGRQRRQTPHLLGLSAEVLVLRSEQLMMRTHCTQLVTFCSDFLIHKPPVSGDVDARTPLVRMMQLVIVQERMECLGVEEGDALPHFVADSLGKFFILSFVHPMSGESHGCYFSSPAINSSRELYVLIFLPALKSFSCWSKMRFKYGVGS